MGLGEGCQVSAGNRPTNMNNAAGHRWQGSLPRQVQGQGGAGSEPCQRLRIHTTVCRASRALQQVHQAGLGGVRIPSKYFFNFGHGLVFNAGFLFLNLHVRVYRAGWAECCIMASQAQMRSLYCPLCRVIACAVECMIMSHQHRPVQVVNRSQFQ